MRHLTLPRALLAPLLALAATVATAEPPPVPAGVEARATRLLNGLTPQARRWVEQEARRVAASNPGSYAESARAAASAAPREVLAGMSIEEAIQLMFMLISRDAEKEMKEILADMERARAEKQAQRDAAARLKAGASEQGSQARQAYAAQKAPPRTARSAELTAYLASQRVSEDDMGEMEGLRLQLAMDRRAKAMEAIANLLRKTSQTKEAILNNLK